MADHLVNLRAHNVRAQNTKGRPFGVITRGTTGINRLRRCDRWMAHHPEIVELLRSTRSPLAVDVGYGASHTTTVEWAGWLRRVNPRAQVTGLEIDPDRVLPPRDGVNFALGGFELAGLQPQLVRAFNVLRQYDVDQVYEAWKTVCQRLAPGGLFVEGTCDELGRHCAWILLDAAGPKTLTLAWQPTSVDKPSQIAERLPKILIHRNRPGEAIYDVLRAADNAWDKCAGWSPYGPRIRWVEATALLVAEGLPIRPIRRRQRDNILTIDWQAVAPDL